MDVRIYQKQFLCISFNKMKMMTFLDTMYAHTLHPKNGDTKLMSVTESNLNRFSILSLIDSLLNCSKVIINDPTTC